MFLYWLRDNQYSQSLPPNSLPISCWKVAGALVRPNGIRRYLYKPKWQVTAVLGLAFSSIWTWWYPHIRSKGRPWHASFPLYLPGRQHGVWGSGQQLCFDLKLDSQHIRTNHLPSCIPAQVVMSVGSHLVQRSLFVAEFPTLLMQSIRQSSGSWLHWWWSACVNRMGDNTCFT